jgi:RHS repeat-associated protein
LLTEIETPDGVVQVTNTYTNGRVTAQVEADGSQISYAYTSNAYGPLTTVTEVNPDGQTNVWEHQYRPDGTLRWTTQNGAFRSAVAWGRDLAPAAMIDGKGETSRMTANAAGLPTSMTTPLNETTSITYDALNRPTRIVDPYGVASEYTYSPQHNVLTATVGITGTLQGSTTTATYTADGRVQTIQGPDGVLQRYDYSPQGRVLTTTLGFGTPLAQITTYDYDALGRVVTTTVGVGTPAERVDVIRYNPDNTIRETIQNYIDGIPVSANGENILTAYGYDLQGRPIWVRDALGRYTATQYDESGRVRWTTQNLTGFSGGTSLPANPPPFNPATPDANVTTFYAYNGMGQTTLITQTGILTGSFDLATRQFSAATERVTRYEYDDSGRLVTTTLNYRPGEPSGPDVNVQTIQYTDGAGNITWQRDPLGRWNRTEYDALSRPITVTLSFENGNPLTIDPANTGWATLTDTDRIEVYRYRDDGQIDSVITNYVDGVFTVTEPDRDRITAYAYDARGRLISTTRNADPATVSDPAQTATNQVTLTQYDPVTDQVQATREPLGRWNHLIYDALGRVSTTVQQCTDATGAFSPGPCAAFDPTFPDRNIRTTTRFHPLGWSAEREDVLGRVDQTVYHPLGWVAQTMRNVQIGVPADSDTNVTTSYGYDALGRVINVTDPTNAVTSTDYDALGRAVSVTDPENRTRTMGYDGTGVQRWMATPDGRVSVFLVDGLGRVTTRIQNYVDGVVAVNEPDDTDLIAQTVYDAAGRQVAVIDAAERRTRYAYDLFDQLTSVTENAADGACPKTPCNVVTSYTYDRAGNRTSITDPRGITTHTFSYDAADRLTSMTDALSQTTSYTYDRGNRMVGVLDPRGTAYSRTIDLDALDRMRQISSAQLSAPIVMTYNGVGWRTALTDATGTTNFGHDDLGRVTTVHAPDTGTVGYAYTARGQRSQITYPNNTVIDYTYGDDGQLDDVLQNTTPLASYLYDAAGRLDQVTRANGAVTSYDYDGTDRLRDLHTTVGGVTRTRFTYTLNRLGLRTAVSETLDTSSRSVSYAYDGLLRLTGAVESGATANTYAYGYDLAGNRTSATVNGVTTTRGYNAANQVTGWSYDAAGNLLNDGTTISTYDALNRLTSQGGASYAYNGDGVLVAQTSGGSTTTYAQDLVAPLSQVLETNGVPIFYGHEQLALPTSTTLIWFLHDGLGSVRQTLDGSGGAPNSVSYDPWGTPQGGLPLTLSGMGFGFTGELQNSASGMVHLRARWYDANAGRFHARDPFEGWAETPYSQHFYQYAYSNPVNWTDPSGQCVGSDCRPSAHVNLPCIV